MRPRSERAAALVLALSALVAAPAHADACAEPPGALVLAAEQQAEGRPWTSAATLRLLSESGCVDAMERLALLHWYGPQLYPGHPWSREEALRWFVRAAERGSAVAQFMTQVARHTPPLVVRRRGP